MENRNKNPSECMEALKKSNASMKQIQVNTSGIEVYHIESVNDQLIRLVDVLAAAEAIAAGGVVTPTATLNTGQFTRGVVESMKTGQYKTILKIGEILLLIDDATRCRSGLVGMCKASGSTFYKGDLLADIALAGELGNRKSVIFGYRMDNRIGVAVRVSSTARELKDLTALSEWQTPELTLGSWTVDNYSQIVEFEAAPVNGFVPVVRCAQSLTGEAPFCREYCIREEQAETSVVLCDVSSLAMVTDYAKRPMRGPAPQIPERLLKTFGKKRSAEFKKLLRTAYDSGGEQQLIKTALKFLDGVGFQSKSPRRTADEELGYMFMGDYTPAGTAHKGATA